MYKKINNLVQKLDISQEDLNDMIKIYTSKYDVFFEKRNKDDNLSFTEIEIKILREIILLETRGEDTYKIKQIIKKLISKSKYLEYLNEGKDRYKVKSPLRFPGSKGKVIDKLVPYFKIDHIEYREPFLGGGSIFFGKNKSKVNLLNDKDENIYALFKTIQLFPNELCTKVLNTTPTLDLWFEKRKNKKQQNLIDTAFDYLFFNRTNYSGIYKANPLGGVKHPTNELIESRWNPNSLVKSIKLCSEKLQNVEITNLNFDEIILRPGENVLLIVDPPYYEKGHQLYPISMSLEEHMYLAKLLRETPHKYLLTIDDCPKTREIYIHDNSYINKESWLYSINSPQIKKVGKELFISNFEINNL